MVYSLYTDGSCYPNPGTGAWAYAVIQDNELLTDNSMKVLRTTNNRMELEAVINGLEYLCFNTKKDDEVIVYTDSTYVINCATISKGKKNRDLVNRLVFLTKSFKSIKFKHVYGHSGVEWNEYVDNLANITRTEKESIVKDSQEQ